MLEPCPTLEAAPLRLCHRVVMRLSARLRFLVPDQGSGRDGCRCWVWLARSGRAAESDSVHSIFLLCVPPGLVPPFACVCVCVCVKFSALGSGLPRAITFKTEKKEAKKPNLLYC